MADTVDLKSAVERRMGSNPIPATKIFVGSHVPRLAMKPCKLCG